MESFTKPAIDVEEQLQLLKSRGLKILDESRARCFLQAVSFFRLTPYMRPFQQPDDPQHHFRPGAGFRDLSRLYDFDRRLRLLVMDAIERVEVAARAVISNHMGPSNGAHWYLEPELFKRRYQHDRLLQTIRNKQDKARDEYQRDCEQLETLLIPEERKERLKATRSRENYARYYGHKYNEPDLMPGWAAMEELTLGELSFLYSGLNRDADKKSIAKRLNLAAPLLESWLHCLTVIRNICAHHDRLWNREPGIKPKLPKTVSFPWPSNLQQQEQHHRMFTVLSILNLLMSQVSPHTSWNRRLGDLFDEFPEIQVRAMGFPEDWKSDPFWQLAAF